MNITVLALDGVFDTGLTAMLDTFATANSLSGKQKTGSRPSYRVEVVGFKREIRTALGLRMTVKPVASIERPDWLVVPAINARAPEQLIAALAGRDVVRANALMREAHAAGARVAAACIGTFVLAESGLLDGHEATTTWWLGPLFRQRYPDVKLDNTRMVVPSGDVVTAGAAMGHLDLALWLLHQASPDVASTVARYLIVDQRASQAPYIIPDHLARADPLVERFERWARGRLAYGFSLDAAADLLATSPRTLQRRIESVLGKSPLSFFQDLRVEHAVHLLRTSRLDIETIATEVGYADGATLRTLLRRRLGRGVRELRRDRSEQQVQPSIAKHPRAMTAVKPVANAKSLRRVPTKPRPATRRAR